MKKTLCDLCGATASDFDECARTELVHIQPGPQGILVRMSVEPIDQDDHPQDLCALCQRIAIRTAAKNIFERILREPSEMKDWPLISDRPRTAECTCPVEAVGKGPKYCNQIQTWAKEELRGRRGLCDCDCHGRLKAVSQEEVMPVEQKG